MFKKSDQESLRNAYTLVYENNLGPAAMGIQPVGKPVMITMDMPGATSSEENEDEHHDHDDSEIEMALSELHRIIKFAPELQKHIQNMDGLEGWVAAKLTKAADYISSIYNWIDYNQSHGDCGCSHDSDMFSKGYEDEEMPEEDCEYAKRGCKCGGCSDCQ